MSWKIHSGFQIILANGTSGTPSIGKLDLSLYVYSCKLVLFYLEWCKEQRIWRGRKKVTLMVHKLSHWFEFLQLPFCIGIKIPFYSSEMLINLPKTHSKYILHRHLNVSLSDFKACPSPLCQKIWILVLVQFLLSTVTWNKTHDLLILLKSLLLKNGVDKCYLYWLSLVSKRWSRMWR